MQIKDADGNPRDVRLIAPEIPDLVRVGLGWALFHPEGVTVRRSGSRGAYRVHVEGRGDVSPDIAPDTLHALLRLRMLNPSPDDPQQAVGNPDFLAENPPWRMYIPDPKRMRR